MTTREPTAREILLDAMSNAAIALAKLAIDRHYDPMTVKEAWVVVREAFVQQMPKAEQSGSRKDLDELFDNTMLHTATRARVTK